MKRGDVNTYQTWSHFPLPYLYIIKMEKSVDEIEYQFILELAG
jgi:hypothetical protein